MTDIIPGDVVRLASGNLARVLRWDIEEGETVAVCRYLRRRATSAAHDEPTGEVSLSLKVLARATIVEQSPLPV